MIDRLFTRDNLTWTLTLVASVLVFALTSTTTLIPDHYAGVVKDIAAVLGFLAAQFRASPLPHSSSV